MEISKRLSLVKEELDGIQQELAKLSEPRAGVIEQLDDMRVQVINMHHDAMKQRIALRQGHCDHTFVGFNIGENDKLDTGGKFCTKCWLTVENSQVIS